MVLERIVEVLSASGRKVQRAGQYAILGLTLAFSPGYGGCDAEQYCDTAADCGEGQECLEGVCGGEEEICPVDESGPCEDFTGLYKIMNFEEVYNCSQHPNPEDQDYYLWGDYQYISIKNYDDCKLGIFKHSEHNESGDVMATPCHNITQARGNYYFGEFPNNGGSFELIKCRDSIFLKRHYSEGVDSGMEIREKNWDCTATLELVPGEEPYSLSPQWLTCER